MRRPRGQLRTKIMQGDCMKSDNSDLIVIASAKAKPGKEAELERALREVTGPTRAQPGCVQFSLYRSTSDRSTLIGFERWASAAHHQRHLQGVHVQKLMGRLTDILAEPPNIVSYEVLDG
jgi:quinol monooxygenase YgiN